MKENYQNLINKFKLIANKRWVKGINNFTNSVGLTFESLLSKDADSMFFPDFQGIEIKCTQRFSHYPITLFTKAFDGPNLYEMHNVLTKYGKFDSIYKDKKILITELSCNKMIFYNNYYFKLCVDKIKQKLYLAIYDKKSNLIEKEAYIEFKTLKSHLETKLSNLALIYASKKTLNNSSYFRYYKIIIYKLISFNKFIELLKQDIIIVEIVGRVSRSGTEAGRQRNKNLVFKIKKENIKKLFNIINTYDNDELNSDFNII